MSDKFENTKKKKKKCLIIDGNNIVHRSYHASQKLVWLKNNKEIYIFLRIIFSVFSKENYEKLLIVFDEGRKTFRNKINESYKSNRAKITENLLLFLNQVKKLLVEWNLSCWSNNDFEADDLIASFVEKFSTKDNYEFHIFSQDKDLFQLLSENVKILRYNQKTIEKFGPKEFFEINKFSHQNFCYYLALMGDKTDNIKGVNGIGKKRAFYIVSNFKNLESTFQQIKEVRSDIQLLIKDQRDLIEKNIKMISLIKNIPTKNWESYNFSWEKFRKNKNLVEFCKNRKFTSLYPYTISGIQNQTWTDID